MALPTTPGRPGSADGNPVTGRLARLGRFTSRRRWWVIGAWLVLTVFGGFAAGQLSSRWYQSLSIPGKPAYEAGQRSLATSGVGVRPPSVVVFHTSGDATKSAAIERAMQRAAATRAGLAHELVLLDRQPDVRLEGPAHDLPAGLSARASTGST